MRTGITKLELYVGNIESYLITLPKVERDRFLEELADILLQQFEDFCVKHEFSRDDPSAIEQFIQTIDPPEAVAKDFKNNYIGKISRLNSFLTRWIRIEKFVIQHPILGALLIGAFFYGMFPLMTIFFLVLVRKLFLTITRFFLPTYFYQVNYYVYSLFSLLNPLIRGVLTLFCCISLIAISWRILRQDNDPKKSFVFMVISLLTYSVLILLENLINSKQINYINILVYNLPDELDPVIIILDIVVFVFIIFIIGTLLFITLNRVNRIEKISTICGKRSITIIMIILLLITSGIISLSLWQVLTPELSYNVERVPLNEIQDENRFEVNEESYSPTLYFSQFLKTYCGAEDHLKLHMDMQGDVIIITETYDSEQAVEQICPYSISGGIKPLQTGTYTLKILFVDRFLNKTDILYEMTVNFTWLPD